MPKSVIVVRREGRVLSAEVSIARAFRLIIIFLSYSFSDGR